MLTSLAPGNQLTTNTWDGENRLTQVALPTGITDTFRYNGDGQRVQTQDSSGATKQVWDQQNILLETDGSNIIQVVYTLVPAVYGNMISQSRNGEDSFYLFDALGSTRQLTNGTGSVTDSYLYDSFGNVLLASGSTTNWFRYIGESGYYSAADLDQYYLRARIYDSSTSRFLSRDPSEYRSWSEDSYLYVANNPILSTDPSGLQPGIGLTWPTPFKAPGTCGGGSSFVNWKILDPKADGWVIQHVTLAVQAFECDGKALAPCVINYWEAWRVIDGKLVQVRYNSKGRPIQIIPATTPNDTFFLPNNRWICLYGTALLRGYARFVALKDIHPPGLRTLPNSAHWSTGELSWQTLACADLNTTMSSGSLKRTGDKPKATTGLWNPKWDGDPTEVVYHAMKTIWNCCPEGCPPGPCPANPSEIQVFIFT